MKLNKSAINLLLARRCMNVSDLAKAAQVDRRTYYIGIESGIYPKQAGKIAKALGVDPEEIILKEE